MVTYLSGDKYITVSEVIQKINYLKAVLGSIETNSDVIQNFRTKILGLLDSKFSNLEENSIYATAMLLDPRFKRIHFSAATHSAKTII